MSNKKSDKKMSIFTKNTQILEITRNKGVIRRITHFFSTKFDIFLTDLNRRNLLKFRQMLLKNDIIA